MTTEEALLPADAAARAAVLRPPALLVSRRAILYWTVRALPLWLVLAGVQVFFLLTTGSDSRRVRVTVLTITVVLALLHLLGNHKAGL